MIQQLRYRSADDLVNRTSDLTSRQMDATDEKNCDSQDSKIEIDSGLAHRTADAIVDALVFHSESKDVAPVPQYDAVIELIGRLRAIVYPVFCALEQTREHVRQQLRDEVTDAGNILVQLIRRCILRNAESCEAMQDRGCPDELEKAIELAGSVDQASRDFAQAFLQKLPAIRASLMTDVQAAYDGDPASRNFDEVILCYPGLTAITIHRLAHELYKLDVPFLPRMMSEWSHNETGIDIHPGATIGDYFFIDHGTGVVIGETCEIGQHVKIYQGVTLGAISFDKDERGQLVRGSKRHPTIEDRVVIYANATVLGGKTIIGKESVIGSSVWVTRSVEPGTTVTSKKPSLRLQNPNDDSHDHYQI